MISRLGNNILKSWFLCFCMISAFGLSAQEYNSPYSRFGLGDLTNPNFMYTRAMGGLGSSYADATNMNPVNPASYSYLNLATYDIGIFAEYATIKDSEITEDRWQGNLDYIGLAFPLRNYKNALLDPKKKEFKFGMAFFLKPYSRVSYDVTTVENIEEIGDVVRGFTGTGGTYNFGWGNSVKYKNVSFGVNLGFIYGKLNNLQQIDIAGDLTALQDNISSDYSISGFTYNAGLLYKLVLNKKQLEVNKSAKEKSLMFGIHGNTGTGFTTKGEFSHIGIAKNLSYSDTIAINQEISGTGKLPATLGIGVNYTHSPQFNIGVDLELGTWADFENTIRPNQTFTNAYKVSVGGKYRPDERGFGSFLERTSYTFGAYYNQDPRIIQSSNFNNYGVNLGMSLPFYYQQNFSSVQFTFDLGRRGVGSIIQENVVQLGVGMNINDDSWFVKRKYN